MSQVSLPVRILLIGAVVFLAVWFTLLRPKSDVAAVPPVATAVVTPATAPQTGLGKAVAGARKVAGQPAVTAAPSTAKSSAITTTPETKPATPAVAIPAAVLAKLPKDVASALAARKVLVLGVIADDAKPWRPIGDDDHDVRAALHTLNRYHGEVFVKQIPAAKLSEYGSLVNDLKVNQTPSVVVIDPNLKGRVLSGYVDQVALNQAIQDARRTSITPRITDAYLHQANRLCATYTDALNRVSLPTTTGKPAWRASFARLHAVVHTFRGRVSSLPAPAKWRSLKQAWVAQTNRANALTASAKQNNVTGYLATLSALQPGASSKLDRRFDAAGLTSCSWRRPS